MLYARRKRLEDLVRAEGQGESFWRDSFDEQARYRLLYGVRDFSDWPDVLENARAWVLRDLGLPHLVQSGYQEADAEACILSGDTDLVLSFLEALLRVAAIKRDTEVDTRLERTLEFFVPRVRTVLREHRIRFDLVEDRFIPLESEELHREVVVPAITLLAGRSGFEEAEAAYMEALEELHSGSPADAVTDGLRALELALDALGFQGNTLGARWKAARSGGVLAAHDERLLEAVSSLVDWLSADRVEMGDTHKETPTTREDAWLTVHVVGALILRLAGGVPRGG